MSQNRTVFPGMQPEDPNQAPQQNYDNSRPNQGGAPHSGTVFPGMNSQPAQPYNPQPQQAPQAPQAQRQQPKGGKPVVGFLYSISRTAFGEYWPLHIGVNTIGTAPGSDIVLNEATVSGNHAEIVIRMMKNPEKLDVSITDARSTNGTMVNGLSLSSSSVGTPLKNGDIITVGEAYELVVLLVDAKEMGLHVSADFIAIQTAPQRPNNFPQDPGYPEPTYPAPHNGTQGYNGYAPEQGGYPQSPSQNGTVPLDGGPAFPQSGKTQF